MKLIAFDRANRPLAECYVLDNADHFTVWTFDGGRALGTIFRPSPGYPKYRNEWQAFATDGTRLAGVVTGPKGAMRKIARHATELDGISIHDIMPPSPREFDKPKTKAMARFLAKEEGRVVGLSIEGDDGVFIYTNSIEWDDGNGSGTFRGDSETAAIANFNARVTRNTEGRS